MSLRETNTLRISPGGTTLMKLRIVPEEPPSSETVTIAVICASCSFNALKTTGRPVPPPITTILGLLLLDTLITFESLYVIFSPFSGIPANFAMSYINWIVL